jgi:hypothetical protein
MGVGVTSARSQLRSAKTRAAIARGEAVVRSLASTLEPTLGWSILEHRFHLARRWRFDIAYPAIMLAIEVEGGVWTKGAHVRGAHFEGDCEKYAEAAILGWTVLRVTPGQIKSGKAAKWATAIAARIRRENSQQGDH